MAAAASTNETSGDEKDWDDWQAGDGDMDMTTCLFCSIQNVSIDAILDHCIATHSFDLKGKLSELGLSFYEGIKIVNFIRAQVQSGADSPSVIEELVPGGAWLEDKYLQPTLESDPLLYGLDDDDSSDDDNTVQPSDVQLGESKAAVEPEASPDATAAPSSADDASPLAAENARLRAENEALRARLASLGELMSVVPENEKPDNDTYYFDSYSHYGIHAEMLKDEVRTRGYRAAILGNPGVVAGKTVLDVGCGTGILSMFCARAGAGRVLAVDCSDILNKAREIVGGAGLQGCVTLVKGKMETLKLPVEKVDVIVSEWMGYALFYESMFDSVIHVRNRLLAPGGRLLPSLAAIYLEGVSDAAAREEAVGWWSDVYGFDMSCMRESVLLEPAVTVVDPATIATDRAVLQSFNLETVSAEELDFTATFSLTPAGACTIDSLVLSFDVFFTADPPATPPTLPTHPTIITQCSGNTSVDDSETAAAAAADAGEGKEGAGRDHCLSTSPHTPPTHWKQTLFPLRTVLQLQPGQCVTGSLGFKRGSANHRQLRFALTVGVADASSGQVVGEMHFMEYGLH